MTDSVVLNDGTSFVLLNDGSSHVLLNAHVDVTDTGGTGGLSIRKRIRHRLSFPLLQKTIQEEEFEKIIIAKPFKILTFFKDIKQVPTLTQYVRKLYDITGKPVTETSQIVGKFKGTPINEMFVRLANIGKKLKLPLTTFAERTITAKPRYSSFANFKLKGKALYGVHIIKMAKRLLEDRDISFEEKKKILGSFRTKNYLKAVKNTGKLSFTFKEAMREWRIGVTNIEIEKKVVELNKKEKNPKKLVNKLKVIFPAIGLLALLRILALLHKDDIIKLTKDVDVNEFDDDLTQEEPKAEPTRPTGPTDEEREVMFNQPSVVVGKVIYSIDLQTMEVELNGNVYNYCNVPQRIFDSFEGAGSKGAFYNREVKGIFLC